MNMNNVDHALDAAAEASESHDSVEIQRGILLALIGIGNILQNLQIIIEDAQQ